MENPTASDESTWHRVKWTDEMVRLLITVVASLDSSSPNPNPNHNPNLSSRIGKWKMVSAHMAHHSLSVSPQQCEDKFNDLSKRYKRLNEILGRGTACDVVEDPSLLSSMPHVSDKDKRAVAKILTSKQLFYREMCAYFNGHRIPVDTESLDLPALRDCGGEGCGGWAQLRMVQLEEERVEIERERLELAKQRMKWMRFRSKKEWEMERKEIENERMLLENERTVLMVKRKGLELGRKRGREEEEEGNL